MCVRVSLNPPISVYSLHFSTFFHLKVNLRCLNISSHINLSYLFKHLHSWTIPSLLDSVGPGLWKTLTVVNLRRFYWKDWMLCRIDRKAVKSSLKVAKLRKARHIQFLLLEQLSEADADDASGLTSTVAIVDSLLLVSDTGTFLQDSQVLNRTIWLAQPRSHVTTMEGYKSLC